MEYVNTLLNYLKNNNMNLKEAIEILMIHNKWRLGSDVVMVEPKKLTEAIDVVLYELLSK